MSITTSGLMTKAVILSTVLILLWVIACGGDSSPAATEAPAGAAAPAPTAITAATTEPAVTAAPVPTAMAAAEEPTPTARPARATATPVPAGAPTPTPDPIVTSTTGRLVASLGTLFVETNIPWGFCMLQMSKRPAYENLIGVDRYNGALIPELSTVWSLSEDGMAWSFKLREGIQFHHGYGEFTADDVKHQVAMVTQEGSESCEANPYRETIDNVEVVDDYNVIFHQKKPDSFTVEFYNFGGHGTSAAMSKKQWDEGGEEAYGRQIVSTGPFQYISRNLGESILYERVPDHWRKTADFEELQMFFIAEEATRLATLLADEAHIVVLPQDLQETAIEQGYVPQLSSLPAVGYSFFFGGQYYGMTDDEGQNIEGTEPWVGLNDNARKVRQAMNMAINKEELHREIFQGRGERQWVYGYHGSLLGWNPEWEEKGPELYNYNPERAKELMKEAGYEDGFKLISILIPHDLVSEQIQIIELIALYLDELGIETEFQQLDIGNWVPMFRNRETVGNIHPNSGSYRDPQFTISSYNTSWSIVASFVTPLIDQKWEELTQATSPADRDRVMQDIGNHMFDEFASMPLFWFPAVVMLNPDVVSEYAFPGNRREIFSHMEFAKAAETQ